MRSRRSRNDQNRPETMFFNKKNDFRGGRPLYAFLGLLSGPARQGWAWPGRICLDILTIFDRTKIKLCENCPWPFCAKWPWTILTQNMDRQFLQKKTVTASLYLYGTLLYSLPIYQCHQPITASCWYNSLNHVLSTGLCCRLG